MEKSPLTIASALAKAQAQFVQPEKNKTVTVRPKTSPAYSFEYADYNAIVDAVRGPLSANGIAFTHLLEFRGERLVLVTKLIHGESGQELETLWPMTGSSDPKEVGGDMTYGKRYSLSAITGCVADDDADADPKNTVGFEDKNKESLPPAASKGAAAKVTVTPPAASFSSPVINQANVKGGIKLPVLPKLQPEEFILSGKLSGKRIDELGIQTLEDWATNVEEHFGKSGIDPETSTTEIARSYRAVRAQAKKLQPSMFDKFGAPENDVQ